MKRLNLLGVASFASNLYQSKHEIWSGFPPTSAKYPLLPGLMIGQIETLIRHIESCHRFNLRAYSRSYIITGVLYHTKWTVCEGDGQNQ